MLSPDTQRLQRDLAARPIAQLLKLRTAVSLTVVGTCGVGIVAVIVPSLVYPAHAGVACVGIFMALLAAWGAFLLQRAPTCKVIWGNHPVLTDVVHVASGVGMLAWVLAFASMIVSRAAKTMNTTAPAWLTTYAPATWWIYIPSLIAGLFGIACVSELLATVARAGQTDGAAERLRFSFLALVLALVAAVPMWWITLTMWGGPGMFFAIIPAFFAVILLARFMSGFVPLLSLTKWAVINAEDSVGHEQRRLEQLAKRVNVLSEDTAKQNTKPRQQHQTEAWAKPVFKGSNRVEKKSGERHEGTQAQRHEAKEEPPP